MNKEHNRTNLHKINNIKNNLLKAIDVKVQKKIIKNDKILYKWQKECIIEYNKFMKSDTRASLIVAPTGCGKSYLISYIALLFVITYRKDVLIMTKRKEIFNDFSKKIIDMKKKLKIVEKINVYDLINKKNDNAIFTKNECNSIYLINTDKFTASKRYKNYENYSFGKIKLLIHDENHHVGSNTLYAFVKYMKEYICEKQI